MKYYPDISKYGERHKFTDLNLNRPQPRQMYGKNKARYSQSTENQTKKIFSGHQ